MAHAKLKVTSKMYNDMLDLGIVEIESHYEFEEIIKLQRFFAEKMQIKTKLIEGKVKFLKKVN